MLEVLAGARMNQEQRAAVGKLLGILLIHGIAEQSGSTGSDDLAARAAQQRLHSRTRQRAA